RPSMLSRCRTIREILATGSPVGMHIFTCRIPMRWQRSSPRATLRFSNRSRTTPTIYADSRSRTPMAIFCISAARILIRLKHEIAMERLMRLRTAVKRDRMIGAWFDSHAGELGAIARTWFEVMRGCGDDVRELLHDGHPTACVGDAALGYV